MKARTVKTSIYKEMSGVTKALGNPHRLEILDLLAQGAVPVEYISSHTTLSIANASQHLQVLKRAGLVRHDRKGKYIYYSLASEDVFEAWYALRKLGFSQNSKITSLLDDYRRKKGALKTITTDQLTQKMEQEDLLILDVRPEQEYRQAHIAGAISTPRHELIERLQHLSKSKEIVAYCRGPLCLLADEAIELLNSEGYRASRLDIGFPDWQAKGLPVEGEKAKGKSEKAKGKRQK
jgi:rhodanese-related sulfurtransferase